MAQKQVLHVMNYLKVCDFELTMCVLDDAEEFGLADVLLALEHHAHTQAPLVNFLHPIAIRLFREFVLLDL